MTRTDYLGSMGTLFLAAALALLLLRPAAGERWFALYGPATVAIPVAVAGALVLARRFRTLAISARRALLFAVPLLLLAVLQIGYWTAFFSLGQRGVVLALARAVVLDVAGPWMPYAAAVLAAALMWPLATAARLGTGDAVGRPSRHRPAL